jgi:hypothetical protein
MQTEQEKALAELDSVMGAYEAGMAGASPPRNEYKVRMAECINRLAKPGSAYRQQADDAFQRRPDQATWLLFSALKALRADIAAGYTQTIEQRVRETVYDDFLEMASEIHEKMHPAPAAVLAGSVLEEHIRTLADANGIALLKPNGKPRAFADLIQDLVKPKDVFSEPQRKVLAGWYGQRTEAAHGHFENVIAEDVPRMIDGIRDFMLRFSA